MEQTPVPDQFKALGEHLKEVFAEQLVEVLDRLGGIEIKVDQITPKKSNGGSSSAGAHDGPGCDYDKKGDTGKCAKKVVEGTLYCKEHPTGITKNQYLKQLEAAKKSPTSSPKSSSSKPAERGEVQVKLSKKLAGKEAEKGDEDEEEEEETTERTLHTGGKASKITVTKRVSPKDVSEDSEEEDAAPIKPSPKKVASLETNTSPAKAARGKATNKASPKKKDED